MYIVGDLRPNLHDIYKPSPVSIRQLVRQPSGQEEARLLLHSGNSKKVDSLLISFIYLLKFVHTVSADFSVLLCWYH